MAFETALEDVAKIKDDDEFAAEWKQKYRTRRADYSQDTARWLRLLRYFHPRTLSDQWQDSKGAPLVKLRRSAGRSVEIYNYCRPIIEVYGSLLAGQKPMPFTLDVPPFDSHNQLSRVRADVQEKALNIQLYDQRIPLHFQDFVTSLTLFGIAYVFSWIDQKTHKLKTAVMHWPGDVLPEWSSDRYGSGSDGIESVIVTERISLDWANRLYPNPKRPFKLTTPVGPDENRPNQVTQFSNQQNSVHILKVWWRNDDKIAYAELDYENEQVLYREDDTGYPDIPMRWASRFPTPGEPPHRSAGVLDDVVGVNTEYNERLSEFADLLHTIADPKYVGKNMNALTVPRLADGSNIYPLAANQDLLPLRESVNQFPFDSFLSRMETIMLTTAGLSRLMMGSLPPGETSGEALNNLLHAAIARLEVVRTPIEWAWKSLMTEVWVPLLVDFGPSEYEKIFAGFTRVDWGWPDITPKDALKNAQVAMALAQQKLISDQEARKRVGVLSPTDEEQQIRNEAQDVFIHPNDVRNTLLAKEAQMQIDAAQQQQQAAQQQAQQAAAQPGQPGQPAGGPPSLDQIQNQAQQLSFQQFQQDQAPHPPIMTPARTAPVSGQPPVVQGSPANARQGFAGNPPR